jgi:DNA-binding NarL/FixJ family response regulator
VTRPRVLLADAHAPLLEAFGKSLAEECEIVGAISDGRALVSTAVGLRPDVIVMDLAMRFAGGADTTRQLKSELPDTRIVFLAMDEETDVAAEAFRAGAAGYLLKRSARSELLPAIREVMHGRLYVTPVVTRGLTSAAKKALGPG